MGQSSPEGGLDGAQGCAWAGPSFGQVEGGVRGTHCRGRGWKLRYSIWVGLPCRGSGLVLSCQEAWVEIKLETTCEGCGAAGDGWREGGSPPTPRTWLQKPGKVPGSCGGGRCWHGAHTAIPGALPCKKCFLLN